MKWKTGENRIDCMDADGSTIGHVDFMDSLLDEFSFGDGGRGGTMILWTPL